MSKPKLDKKIQIPNEVLASLLTASELRMLKNRWQIAGLLDEGLSIRNIAKQVKVGTDTVVRVARMVKKLPPKPLPFKTNTPWIFGKSDD